MKRYLKYYVNTLAKVSTHGGSPEPLTASKFSHVMKTYGEIFIKLHLKSLKDITREDAKLFTNIPSKKNIEVWGYYDKSSDGNHYYQYLTSMYDDLYCDFATPVIGNPYVWHELLQRGYDLFELINKNLAVKL